MNGTISLLLKSKVWTTRTNVFKINSIIARFFRIPISFYGNFLLMLAILFSSLSTVYLKTIYREHMHLLQSAQSYYETLEEKRYRLQIEHESLTSTSRLQKLSQQLDLMTPDFEHTHQLLKT